MFFYTKMLQTGQCIKYNDEIFHTKTGGSTRSIHVNGFTTNKHLITWNIAGKDFLFIKRSTIKCEVTALGQSKIIIIHEILQV